MKKRSLKEIALYLLEQYELSESEVLGEFSGNIKFNTHQYTLKHNTKMC